MHRGGKLTVEGMSWKLKVGGDYGIHCTQNKLCRVRTVYGVLADFSTSTTLVDERTIVGVVDYCRIFGASSSFVVHFVRGNLLR